MALNRHQRRKMLTTGYFPMVTRVHEAGHALGRVLIVRELGMDLDHAIHNIIFDPKAGMATTYGPAVTLEMNARLAGTSEEITSAQIQQLCDGIDLEHWMRLKLFDGAMGPAAEARFLGQALSFELLSGPHCKGDLEDMLRYAIAAGIDNYEHQLPHLNVACVLAQSVVQHAPYWTAVLRLAKAMPDRGGVFAGKRAIKLLGVTPWEPGMMDRWRRRLRIREEDMATIEEIKLARSENDVVDDLMERINTILKAHDIDTRCEPTSPAEAALRDIKRVMLSWWLATDDRYRRASQRAYRDISAQIDAVRTEAEALQRREPDADGRVLMARFRQLEHNMQEIFRDGHGLCCDDERGTS